MSNMTPKAAHPRIAQQNIKSLETLPFADQQDFEDAARGFIDTIPDAQIVDKEGQLVWSMAPYAYQQDEQAPETVHPSLWRQARLNNLHGLFEVAPGLYQIRGFDLANMTIVEGKTGIIVIDTTTTVESARAGLELYRKHRGNRAVKAVLITHSHGDHWGGILGVVDISEVRSGLIPIIAPAGFNESSIAEYVIAGNAMERRAHYQFGTLLPVGERQQVDTGLGKRRAAAGQTSFLPATDFVHETGEIRILDGLEFVFQMAPNTEAPAEFHIYIPTLRALNLAENATHVCHNLLPFRGTQVRNSLNWSHYINEALDLWGHDAEILLGQHHWPIWGNERLQLFLTQQRDFYKFLHDQTLRLANHGYKPAEISEQLKLPASLDNLWHLRGYYGHLKHNVKAIYQYYFGWYDANPATLDQLPPIEQGQKIVEYMGGMDALIAKARLDFEAGAFRFVAQVMSHAVFAEPTNTAARQLLADSFEQMGYAAECGTWRNAYLVGAYELRHELPKPPSRTPVNPSVIAAMATNQILDLMAVRLDGERAANKKWVIEWAFKDTNEIFWLNLDNAALTYTSRARTVVPDLRLKLDRSVMNRIILGETTYPVEIANGIVTAEGRIEILYDLLDMQDNFPRMFEISEPKRTM